MKPYYENELGRLYHGDCLEILPHLEPVDLVLTDPPYGINYNREKIPQSKHVFSHRLQIESVKNDDKSFDPIPILKFGKKHILWGANCYASKLPDSQKWIVWDKVTKNGLNLRIAECEFAWSDCIGRPMVFRYLWSGAYREGEKKSFLHPTQKSTALFIWCIRLSKSSGIICDPFLGSGTTAVACERLKRKWIGIEIEEKYCEIAVKRIEHERQQLKLF